MVTDQEIHDAAAAIRSGALVAFPTETVYGLGANALSGSAIEKIFQLKGREKNKPILIIASDLKEIEL